MSYRNGVITKPRVYGRLTDPRLRMTFHPNTQAHLRMFVRHEIDLPGLSTKNKVAELRAHSIHVPTVS
jgi:hypothetical protein